MEKEIKYLDFLINHNDKTSQYLNAKKLNSTQFFCIGLLERLTNSSHALKTMLSQIEINPSLEYACGIILRSNILDTLIVLNLYKILIENEHDKHSEKEKEQRVTDFCNTILSDGLDSTVKYIKLARDVNFIDQNQLEETLRNFTKSHQIFFEPHLEDGSLPVLKNKNKYSPRELFTKLANANFLKELSKIYDTYLFFSKYDHFGILYYEVSRTNSHEQLKRISKSIELFLGSQSILFLTLRIFSGDDEFLNEQSRIASKYLSDNILFPLIPTS